MGDTARPIPERLGDQHEQARHLSQTGNGPTVANEAQLLAEQYGPADGAGFHSAPEQPVGHGDTTEGGTSA
ncbi:hypothetical protein [Streptomyces sp. NPDC046727]|uniref:hypothetical protein n=1 Tax=Streptomyces sp. NPDC046727 TaxID=3155373 RepID=UPI0033FA5269